MTQNSIPQKEFSNIEKVQLVLEGLKGRKTIEDICLDANVHPEVYYKWQNAFIKAGSTFLAQVDEGNFTNQILKNLEKQNQLLEKIIEMISDIKG